jgi:AraC-like DNA-binding protein
MPLGDLKTSNNLLFHLARMEARGFDAEQVLAGTGLTVEDVNVDFFRPEPGQWRDIISNIIRLTEDPHIGISLGAEFKISDFGVLGYAVLSSSTMSQAREIWSKYSSLNEGISSRTNTVSGDTWVSEIEDTLVLGELLPFAVEEFASRTIELATCLTNRPFPILEMQLTYDPPDDMTAYDRRFNCPISFNQPRNLIFFDVDHLNDPISLANEEVFKLCERQCQLLASKMSDGTMLLQQIRATLVNNPGEFPSLEGMAKKMKMGSRTLRRRLAKEDLKYQQILDDTRKELAIQYLEHTTLTPKEIGFLLGYASVSNFRRAFKSWTGKKLTDFRPPK